MDNRDALSKTDGIYRVIVTPDKQFPLVDELSCRAVRAYMRDHRWDEHIDLGDFMDWDFISRWTADSARATEGKRFTKEYADANKELDKWVDATRFRNPDAKFTLIEGNHDYRPEVVIDKTPLYEGMIEMESNLFLKDRKINWHRYWSHRKAYKIGKALFVHGEHIGLHHAKKMADEFGENVFYGHTHDIQQYSVVRRGSDKTIVGQSLGCLCQYDLPYMGHKPSRWQQGFGVFHFFPDGHFTYFVVRIFKHRFVSPEGKIYDGNKLPAEL